MFASASIMGLEHSSRFYDNIEGAKIL